MKNSEQETLKEQYSFMVVPLNKEEASKAIKAGKPNTFCASLAIAEEVKCRQNKHSGILWKVRQTNKNDKINWAI